MGKNILIGVAWPYVNGDLHLGHLFGYLLPADIFARFNRIVGNNVLMVSGSDCHGTPITIEADSLGITPQEIIDIYHKKNIELFNKYNISFDLYTTTTTENHKRIVQEMFLDLLKNGYISKGVTKQYYSSEDNKFLPDRYVEGICPYCKASGQRSDQCESCGKWLGEGELIDPISKISKNKVELKDTEHYFLNLDKLTPELKEYVESKKGVWKNWVYKESLGWINEGLNKRAITRDMDWAIELPVDEIKKLPKELQLDDFSGKKIYVWFEAVIGYLSATIEATKDKYKEWWLNPEAQIYNFMGQDNLVFHTIMWPAELIGSKKGYTLPHNVVVNKFMNLEGKKFSKSRNWTINSMNMTKKYEIDEIRYYIASNLPENKEGDFTWNGFVDSINNELVANLGNFINRTLKFFEKNFNGKLSGNYTIEDKVRTEIEETFKNSFQHFENVELVAALNDVMNLSQFGNKYFDEKKIWEVIKTDKNKAENIMFNLLNIIENLKTLISPFLPETQNKLSLLLHSNNVEQEWETKIANNFALKDIVNPLFNKLDKETVLNERDSNE